MKTKPKHINLFALKIVLQATEKNGLTINQKKYLIFFRKLKECTTSRMFFFKIERNITFFKILFIFGISYVRTKGAQ